MKVFIPSFQDEEMGWGAKRRCRDSDQSNEIPEPIPSVPTCSDEKRMGDDTTFPGKMSAGEREAPKEKLFGISPEKCGSTVSK